MQKDTDIIIYQTEDGKTKIEVTLADETVWLTQAQLVELFQSSKANISEHIKHIFKEGELDEKSVVRKFRTTAADGKDYSTNYYNLDVILAVGYRVRTGRGTQFRIWATQVLREYLVKGFALNDDFLKNMGGGIAPTGGYIAGKSELIELISYKMTSPALGVDIGSYEPGYKLFFEGLFVSPHVVAQAKKLVILASRVLTKLGYKTIPNENDVLSDIVCTIMFNDKNRFFC